MSADGTWDTILARLLAAAEEAVIIDWAVAVDSTIARRDTDPMRIGDDAPHHYAPMTAPERDG